MRYQMTKPGYREKVYAKQSLNKEKLYPKRRLNYSKKRGGKLKWKKVFTVLTPKNAAKDNSKDEDNHTDKDLEDFLMEYKENVHKKNTKSPVPAVKLSEEQWKCIESVSVLVSLDQVGKNGNHGFQPQYKRKQTGAKFNQPHGALVVEADSLGLTRDGSTSMFPKTNLICVGSGWKQPSAGKTLTCILCSYCTSVITSQFSSSGKARF